MANFTISKDIDTILKLSTLQVHTRGPFYPNAVLYTSSYNNASVLMANTGDTLDFSLQPERSKLIFTWTVQQDYSFGVPTYITEQQGKAVEEIIGGEYLIGLADAGTGQAFIANDCNMSAAKIDAFFTDLPTASYTATLDFRNNPGSATCDTSIATNKGYTVIT